MMCVKTGGRYKLPISGTLDREMIGRRMRNEIDDHTWELYLGTLKTDIEQFVVGIGLARFLKNMRTR